LKAPATLCFCLRDQDKEKKTKDRFPHIANYPANYKKGLSVG
jgi:hypothetical protein